MFFNIYILQIVSEYQKDQINFLANTQGEMKNPSGFTKIKTKEQRQR